MRSLLKLLLLTSAAATQAAAPNFLFIFTDDQGWSATSVAMLPGNQDSRTASYRMPNLDRLAARGTVFSQGYASHPKCECSRAALLMGRSTTSLNATDKRSRDWNAAPSDGLANVLKRANPAYRAAHFGKWQWPTAPDQFGFDASDGVTQNEDGDSDDPKDPKQSFGITRRATAYMEQQAKAGRPFYLQLSYYATHSQPQALAETLKKYSAAPAAESKGGRGGKGGPVMAAMSEDLDTCIGTLIQRLESLGLSKNTYVIYMADNGMGGTLLKGGKTVCDEGGLRVPLIVAGPGVKSGVYANAPAVSYDILPTILDLAAPGFALPKGVEGGSWKPVLFEGAATVRRPIDRLVWHHDVEIEHPQTAMRKGDLKLVHYWDTKEDFLYDLSKDLGEKTNLAKSRADVTAKMLTELKAHVKAGVGEQKFAQLESGKLPTGDAKGKGKKKKK
jgi:arylsulfatase A